MRIDRITDGVPFRNKGHGGLTGKRKCRWGSKGIRGRNTGESLAWTGGFDGELLCSGGAGSGFITRSVMAT